MELLKSNSYTNLGTSEVDGEGAGEGVDNAAEKVVMFCKTPKTKNEIQEHLGIKSDRYARQEIIQPLLAAGRLARTIPEKPSSPKQKYIAI